MDRFFDWFLLATVGCLGALGIARAILLYSRGVQVLAIDRERSLAQALGDLLVVLCFLLWMVEIVVHAWPLGGHIVPPALASVVVDALPLKLSGALLMLAGLLLYAIALGGFGDSWRLGIDRNTPGRLVTEGVFAWTRNPIYVSLDLLLLGSFLVQGRLVFLGLAAAIAVMLHLQIRREESFLAEAYGAAYRDYCAHVGRYLTWRRPPG